MRVNSDDSDWLYSYSIFINSNHLQHISFYIESLWFEYELCVISNNLSFNISCFRYHSISYIIYTLHTLYQYLLFTSTDSTVFTISERWYRDEWMNDKRSVWMMCIGSLLIDVKKELRSNDKLLRLLNVWNTVRRYELDAMISMTNEWLIFDKHNQLISRSYNISMSQDRNEY